VHFSCKISSSVLSFFEHEGMDITPLLEATSLPEEFLRDPSFWMSAEEVEYFLGNAVRASETSGAPFENLLQKIGYSGPQLRSWGIFDSVLRMMPRPQEILFQPERFLAYFISPAPPIENVQRQESGIEFDLPISTEQYPLTTMYLAASFESLPLYGGQSAAACEWQGIHLKIWWQSDQNTMFGAADLGHTMSPDLMRNVLSTLEKHSKALEEKNRELQEKNEVLTAANKIVKPRNQQNLIQSTTPREPAIPKNAVSTDSPRTELPKELEQELGQQLSRLEDYMFRAKQLITLLIAQGRQTPQVKEAIRRVDWQRVEAQLPKVINDCRHILHNEPLREAQSLSNNSFEGENFHV
jgi:hypothetical protein